MQIFLKLKLAGP